MYRIACKNDCRGIFHTPGNAGMSWTRIVTTGRFVSHMLALRQTKICYLCSTLLKQLIVSEKWVTKLTTAVYISGRVFSTHSPVVRRVPSNAKCYKFWYSVSVPKTKAAQHSPAICVCITFNRSRFQVEPANLLNAVHLLLSVVKGFVVTGNNANQCGSDRLHRGPVLFSSKAPRLSSMQCRHGYHPCPLPCPK